MRGGAETRFGCALRLRCHCRRGEPSRKLEAGKSQRRDDAWKAVRSASKSAEDQSLGSNDARKGGREQSRRGQGQCERGLQLVKDAEQRAPAQAPAPATASAGLDWAHSHRCVAASISDIGRARVLLLELPSQMASLGSVSPPETTLMF